MAFAPRILLRASPLAHAARHAASASVPRPLFVAPRFAGLSSVRASARRGFASQPQASGGRSGG
ncbi:hypothetical protein BX616_009276, partial [Lobosporangium transversale]